MNGNSVPAGGDLEQFDVIVVGAGFAALYALHTLRQRGLKVRVVEAGPAIGGTWFWNAYPGARCDVESFQYSYSFSPELDQEWTWSERYAAQPEILRYIEYVADRFDLRRDIELNTRVVSATYDETATRWQLTTESGLSRSAQFVVFATGSLSAPLEPRFPGMDRFAGASYYTQRWPHSPVDFHGKRVAVIGTGSSGIQLIPVVAEQAQHITVFQRTPNFSAPGHNRPLGQDETADWKTNYPQRRAQQSATYGGVVIDINRREAADMTDQEQRAELQRRWELGGVLPFTVAFRDVLTNIDSNAVVQEFFREKIRERVRDARTAELTALTEIPH